MIFESGNLQTFWKFQISKFLLERKRVAGPRCCQACRIAHPLVFPPGPETKTSGAAGPQPLQCESGRLIIDLPALMRVWLTCVAWVLKLYQLLESQRSQLSIWLRWFRWLKMTTDDLRLSEMAQDDLRWLEMTRDDQDDWNDSGWLEMTQDYFRRLKKTQGDLRQLETTQNNSR